MPIAILQNAPCAPLRAFALPGRGGARSFAPAHCEGSATTLIRFPFIGLKLAHIIRFLCCRRQWGKLRCISENSGTAKTYHSSRGIVLSIIQCACGEVWNAHASGIASRSNAAGRIVARNSFRANVMRNGRTRKATAAIGRTCTPSVLASHHAAYATCPRFGAARKSQTGTPP